MYREFRVNDNTRNDQYQPNIASVNGVGFVVCWTSNYNTNGGSSDVHAKLYDYKGRVLKSEFQVNSQITLSNQDHCAIANTTSGFTIAWTSTFLTVNGTDIYFKNYDFYGNPTNNETLATDTTVLDQKFLSIAGYQNGDFIISWFSQVNSITAAATINAKIFYNNGTSKTGEIGIYSFYSYGVQTSVQAFDNGDAKVVFVPSGFDDSSFYNLLESTIYANNTASIPFTINNSTNIKLFNPIITKGNGEYFVNWESKQTIYDIIGKFFFNNDTQIDNEFTVNNYTIGVQMSPAATYTDDIIVSVWESNREMTRSTLSYGVYGQRYFLNHTKNGDEFKINEYSPNDQYQPKIAPLNEGAFIVVWTSDYQDGSDSGIYAKIIDKYTNTVSMSDSSSSTLTSSKSSDISESKSKSISNAITATISTTNSLSSVQTLSQKKSASASLTNTASNTITQDLEKPAAEAHEETSHIGVIAGVSIGAIALLVGGGILGYKMLHTNPSLPGENFDNKLLGDEMINV